MLDDVVGEEGKFHADVLRSLHRRVEIKVFQVEAKERGRDYNIEEKFDSEQVCCWGTDVADEVGAASVERASCAVDFALLGADVAYESDACHIFPTVAWDLALVNEEHCVGAVGAARHTLAEAANLVAERMLPVSFVFWTFDEVRVFE